MSSEPRRESDLAADLSVAIDKMLSRLDSDLAGTDPSRPESAPLVEPIKQLRRSLERLRQTVREPEPDHERTDR